MDKQENKLLKKAIKGDAQAFSVLLEKYYMMIYRTAYKWCQNKSDSEDIAQEVCIKIGHSINTFRMDSTFSSWIYRITINTAKDCLRKRKHHMNIEEVPSICNSENDCPHQQIETHQLWQIVDKLPEKQRDAVLLVYSEGINHNEAAQILGCSESTVSWYIHEAKKQLSEWVKDDER